MPCRCKSARLLVSLYTRSGHPLPSLSNFFHVSVLWSPVYRWSRVPRLIWDNVPHLQIVASLSEHCHVFRIVEIPHQIHLGPSAKHSENWRQELKPLWVQEGPCCQSLRHLMSPSNWSQCSKNRWLPMWEAPGPFSSVSRGHQACDRLTVGSNWRLLSARDPTPPFSSWCHTTLLMGKQASSEMGTAFSSISCFATLSTASSDQASQNPAFCPSERPSHSPHSGSPPPRSTSHWRGRQACDPLGQGLWRTLVWASPTPPTPAASCRSFPDASADAGQFQKTLVLATLKHSRVDQLLQTSFLFALQGTTLLCTFFFLPFWWGASAVAHLPRLRSMGQKMGHRIQLCSFYQLQRTDDFVHHSLGQKVSPIQQASPWGCTLRCGQAPIHFQSQRAASRCCRSLWPRWRVCPKLAQTTNSLLLHAAVAWGLGRKRHKNHRVGWDQTKVSTPRHQKL